MKKSDLGKTEFESYFGRYIDKVSDALELVNGFITERKNVIEFFEAIPKDKWEHRYSEGKWTIKEVLQHIIDTERIFSYRLFRIARNDKTPLASFDQNFYVATSRANEKSGKELLEEYSMTRDHTLSIVQSLRDSDLECIGISSGSPLSARAVGFLILGHEVWHMDIIKERYLN